VIDFAMWFVTATAFIVQQNLITAREYELFSVALHIVRVGIG
jgi:hypothetical protein